MIKKKRPARSDAAQRAERRKPIERAVRELEVLEEALKKYSAQVRQLRLAREALLADLRNPDVAGGKGEADAEALRRPGSRTGRSDTTQF